MKESFRNSEFISTITNRSGFAPLTLRTAYFAPAILFLPWKEFYHWDHWLNEETESSRKVADDQDFIGTTATMTLNLPRFRVEKD
jgi:hypothetical protein